MTQKLSFCSQCLRLEVLPDRSSFCPSCNAQIEKDDLLNPESALGLIGLPYSGKTVYLATLHEQLMHAAPEWQVEVDDFAFRKLTDDYQGLRKGVTAPATQLGEPDFFRMKVIWRNRKLDLIMWDTGGEIYDYFVETKDYDDSTLGFLLFHCKSIMVAILCQRIQGTLKFSRDSIDEDQFWGRFFRKILQSQSSLRRVVVLLVGVDVYGNTPDQANREVLEDFNLSYRIFPGVLKNAGVKLEVVPLSNIGFGNAFDPETHRLSNVPPRPYNALEPLRRVYPAYLSWWSRKLFHFTKVKGAGSVSYDTFEDKMGNVKPDLSTETNHTNPTSDVQTVQEASYSFLDPLAKKSRVAKLLFLAANPSDTTRLRLDREIREIDQALRQTKFRDKFDIRQHWAVRVADLQGYLLRYRPDIVHFSGHGSRAREIILEDISGMTQPVPARALSQLFYVLKDNIRCVVLNACYSEQQAEAIAEHIDCVVGMSKAIGDSAAISFATAFYQALGYGRNVKTAFDLGCVQIDLDNLDEQNTPKLLAINAKPEEVMFVNTG